VRFYKNVLLFEDLGGKKYYPKVNAPSVALRLDLNTVKKRMDKNMIEYFFMKKNKILQKLPYHKIKYFQRCYPAFNFNQLFNNAYIPALAG
jgi:hypothetical protein